MFNCQLTVQMMILLLHRQKEFYFYLYHDVAYEIFQVPRRAASLNSGDMFVLETPYVAYLWRGKVITLFNIDRTLRSL